MNTHIDIEQLANLNAVQSGCEYKEDLVRISKGYLAGYNKSQETHSFSEIDVLSFAEWCVNNTEYEFNTTSSEILLKAWKEQKNNL